MKKYLLVLVSLCCALLPALAEHQIGIEKI